MKFARLACVLSLIFFCASISEISAKAPETATVFGAKEQRSRINKEICDWTEAI